ncbi:MAG: hypothetical protein J7L95_08065 [Prolixibacteraceae bacterium]|nr:hypothetical protein [Prolixibacteraceae bacterium]
MMRNLFNIFSKAKPVFIVLLTFSLGMLFGNSSNAQALKAGTGKSNITADCGNVHDSLYVKALVLKNKNTNLAIITLDAITVGGIGDIPNDYFENIRKRLREEFKINNVLVNASHNHYDGFMNGGGKLVDNVEEKTMQAVAKALKNFESVKVGAGSGFENRISMNRRIKLKDGSVFTIRHANPNMPDDEVVGIGEIDPEIGILRIDRYDGTSKAVVYNFACHPYTGLPGKGVTAEYPGFASKEIEDNLGNGTMAFFLQGATGNITEILYKNVSDYRDCEPFGRMLGASTLKGFREIETSKTKQFSVISKTIELPLRQDISDHIKELENQEKELLASLRSTSLNMKTFIPLYIKYALSPDFPSYYSYRYLQEEKEGIEGLTTVDKENRSHIEKYIQNMRAMDKLAQIQENKAFLKIKQGEIEKTNKKTISTEIEGIRIGDFVLVTFPGEPFAEIGLNIKEKSPYKYTFLAGYSNGYMHYAPTADSYKEWGYEVMNCILAPEWQAIYEQEIQKIIKKL